MLELLNLALLMTAVGGVLWGISKGPLRFYQLPVLSSALVLVFIVPSFNGDIMTGLPEDAIAKTILMTLLCLVALWKGYGLGLTTRVSIGRPGHTDRILIVGVALSLLSAASYAKLGQLTAGSAVGFFTAEGAYAQLMEGPLVLYKALASFGQVGLMLCLIGLLRRPSATAALAVVGALVIPIAVAVFLGRRSETISLLLTIALVLFFERRMIVPRLALILAIPMVMVLVLVAPEYRKHSQIGGDLSKAIDVDVAEQFSQFVSEGATEVRNGVYIIGATDREMALQWGANYYNGVVRNFVPRFIVGADLKQSLMFQVGLRDAITEQVYGWNRAFYSFPYGPAVAFEQFWYFGFFVFGAIGYLMAMVWKKAVAGDLWSQVLYAATVVPALYSFLTDQSGLIVRFLYMLVLVGPLILWVNAGGKAPGAPHLMVSRGRRASSR